MSDGKGVVATFFLIRYQSVVASRREISFACQFFRISLFIITVQQDFGDALPEGLRREVTLDAPSMTNGNAARFLGHNNGHRIRFLRDPEAGAMAQSQTAIKCLPLAHRENAGGGGQAPISNNGATIMQSRFGMEQGQHELDRKSPSMVTPVSS